MQEFQNSLSRPRKALFRFEPPGRAGASDAVFFGIVSAGIPHPVRSDSVFFFCDSETALSDKKHPASDSSSSSSNPDADADAGCWRRFTQYLRCKDHEIGYIISTFEFPQFEALPKGWETRESRTTGASPAPRAATCAGGFRRRLPRDGA